MLRANNLSYTYPGREKPSLSDICLALGSGECVCVIGPSGCGKSTLLLALKGLLQDGIATGEIIYGDGSHPEYTRLSGLGLVFQNAESQLLCATVFDEVAFGPENLCLPPPEINHRIVEALRAVNLLDFGNRNVERFSAGQKQRLCIASVLSMHPGIILLDEPTSQLDRKGKDHLCSVLTNLKKQGISIIIAEHNIEPFVELIDRYYVMDGGRINAVLCSPPHQYRDVPQSSAIEGCPKSEANEANRAISVKGLCFSYPGNGTTIHDLSLAVSPGELIHIYGENGCGKSTLLKVLAGALQPDSGNIDVLSRNFPEPGRLLGTVALLYQNPQRQLFEDSVYDEVAFTLKRLRVPPEEIDTRVQSALAACEASHLAERLPLTLSFGEQHRVALASIIAPDPRILLLDEPFAGLDPAQRLRLLRILSSLRESRGTAIVIASHDPLPDPDWADRTLLMEDGKFVTEQDGRS